jgi:hypothetical protein
VIAFVALLLLLEGFWTALWIAGLLPSLAGHSSRVVTVITLRATVGVAQIMAARFLLAGRAGGRAIAQVALIGSAALLTIELGARMSPSNLDPSWRWPVVAAYWIYAAALSVRLRR